MKSSQDNSAIAVQRSASTNVFFSQFVTGLISVSEEQIASFEGISPESIL